MPTGGCCCHKIVQVTTMSEIEVSNGNVYADIDENADAMLVKAQLAACIQEILNSRKLTQTQAAEILGLPQPELSRMLQGHFRGISETKMMNCITRLGRDVRIVIGPEHRTGQTGHIEVVHA